jgi:hypothetical protein
MFCKQSSLYSGQKAGGNIVQTGTKPGPWRPITEAALTKQCGKLRAARSSPRLKIADRLATAHLYLQLNPNDEENRALRKLLPAVADGHGTAHALLFSGEPGELI